MWAKSVIVAAVLAGALAQQCKDEIKRKNPDDCGEYYLCPLGKPTENHCSLGLAYNKDKGYCDWADLVEDCDVERYLDFECPDAASYDAPGTNKAFPYPADCAKQLVCVPSAFEDYKRLPRLLSCDKPEVFNPEIGKCDYYKEVKGCEKYYENTPKKVAPVKEDSEIAAGAIPEARVVSRNPTSRPVPEVRRKVSTKTTSTSTTKKPEEPEYDDDE